MSGPTPKKVDESWKDSVRKEKETVTEGPAAPVVPEIDLLSFVSTLAMQALSALGEMKQDAAAAPAKTDLVQAKYLIDIIQMLSEKTRGNLTEEETNELNTLLYELRMRFVRKSQGTTAS